MRLCGVVWALAFLALATAQEPTSDELNAFLDWFKARGGQAPLLSLAPFPGMGVGVAATQAVAEGDTVLVVPLEIVATRSTILKVSPSRAREVFSRIESDEQLIAAFLVQQRALGASSSWSPYIQALPKYIPLTFTLPDEDLALFQDPKAISAAKSRRRQVSADFDDVKTGLIELLRLDGISHDTIPLKEWYFHAVSVVDSRALTIRGQKYLVPFADMFNYSPHQTQREADRGNHFLKYHVLGSSYFTVLADRPAKSGEQLFEDYGDNDNSIYVHHHGFSPLNNPFDCIAIELPELRRSDSNLSQKRSLAKSLQLSSSMPTCITAAGLEAIPRRVLDWLYLVSMTSTGFAKCSKLLEGEKSRQSLEQCFGSPYSKDSVARVAGILRKQAKLFSTSLSEDVTALENSALTSGQRLAITYRMSRKSLIDRIVQRLEHTPTPSPTVERTRSTPTGQDSSKPNKLDLNSIVTNFNAWFQAAAPTVSYIEAALAPQGMRLGAYATRDISPEEVYLAVPLELVMDLDSAYRTPIRGLFAELKQRFRNGDPFHELLFHLMYETFQVPFLGRTSYWKPYLDTLPTSAELDFPLYYSSTELDELQGSAAKDTIIRYQAEVSKKYNSINKLLNDFTQYFDESVFTFENYRWAHATLDSRAIWWGGERHLVPLLDLINCKEGPDPARVHKTSLDDSEKYAVTLSPWAFKKGEQFFENYGQPNHIYFTYHGFVLDDNSHDCVVLPLGADAITDEDAQTIAKRLKAADLRPTYSPCLTPDTITDKELQYLTTGFSVPRDGAWGKLRQLAEARLSTYATTAQEDVALLASEGKSWRFYNTVKLRMQEKNLLSGIIAAARRNEGADQNHSQEL